MSLVNTTDVGSSATVPDAGATTKWKDYIWIRRLGAAGEAKFYIWNENATSDATYLKWQEKSDVVVSDIPMTEGQMLVGGTGNVGTAVALSGHAEVTKTGAVTVNAVADDKITNAMVKSDAGITSGKLAAIPYAKVTTQVDGVGQVANADLAGSIANDKLVGGISQGKLEGLIPVSKLFLADGDIPFGKIDKIFEKNIDIQGVVSTANGNFPEYSTPTGMAIPQVDDNGIIATIADTTPTPSAAWQASQTPP
ncbi:MAG TPA: hypothetical protein EYN93_02390, partial [Planctomycetaceae bacterium]|nr:hypothetical protein [Planctomycetaceae bacterium]